MIRCASLFSVFSKCSVAGLYTQVNIHSNRESVSMVLAQSQQPQTEIWVPNRVGHNRTLYGNYVRCEVVYILSCMYSFR